MLLWKVLTLTSFREHRFCRILLLRFGDWHEVEVEVSTHTVGV